MRFLHFFLVPLLLFGCTKKGAEPDSKPSSPGVYLYPPSRITGRSLFISWSPYLNSDFSSYRLYHSTTGQVDTSSELLFTDTLSYDTTFCDTGLAENTRYYYRVYVFSSDSPVEASDLTSGFTQGGNYCFYLQMGNGFGLPGEKITIPLTLVNCAKVGGYKIVVKWENQPVDSFRTEQGSYWVEGKKYYFEIFNTNSESINDSTKAIVVGIAGDRPPMPPSEVPDTLLLFTFWLNPNWDGQPVPIHFLTKDPYPYPATTISDPTGSSLYCASADCSQSTCPPNPAIKLTDGQITYDRKREDGGQL